MPDFKIERLPVSMEPDTARIKGDGRKHPRHRLTQGLRMQLYTPPAEAAMDAELTDVSREGAGFITQNELQRGMIVMFSCGGQRIYARVEYCHGCAAGYHAGVRIHDAVDEP